MRSDTTAAPAGAKGEVWLVLRWLGVLGCFALLLTSLVPPRRQAPADTAYPMFTLPAVLLDLGTAVAFGLLLPAPPRSRVLAGVGFLAFALLARVVVHTYVFWTWPGW